MSFNIFFVIETIGFTNSNLFDYVNHLCLFTSTTKPFLNVSSWGFCFFFIFYTIILIRIHKYLYLYRSVQMQVLILLYFFFSIYRLLIPWTSPNVNIDTSVEVIRMKKKPILMSYELLYFVVVAVFSVYRKMKNPKLLLFVPRLNCWITIVI